MSTKFCLVYFFHYQYSCTVSRLSTIPVNVHMGVYACAMISGKIPRSSFLNPSKCQYPYDIRIHFKSSRLKLSLHKRPQQLYGVSYVSKCISESAQVLKKVLHVMSCSSCKTDSIGVRICSQLGQVMGVQRCILIFLQYQNQVIKIEFQVSTKLKSKTSC